MRGYICANDVSARDLQFGDGQWTRGKSPDTFCPVGPAVVPASEISDPHDLRIRAIVSGEVLQDSTTANLIFGVDEIISHASQTITLEPGDLILTGTPAGVGVFRDPQRLLQPGDEVTIEIEGVGSLTNPVVAGCDAVTVERTVLREQVKEILLERILRGELEPGERLVETRLARARHEPGARARGAARPPAPAARRVGAVPGRACGRSTTRSCCRSSRARGARGPAAREAAARAEGDVRRARAEVAEMRRAAGRGDWRTQIRHDLAFHRTMVEMADNEPLLQSWLVLGIEVSTAFATYWTYWDQSTSPSSMCRSSRRSARATPPGRARRRASTCDARSGSFAGSWRSPRWPTTPTTSTRPEEQRRGNAHLRKVIDAAHKHRRPVAAFVGRDRPKTPRQPPRVPEGWPGLRAAERGVKIAIENCPMIPTYDEWPGGEPAPPKTWREMFETISENLAQPRPAPHLAMIDHERVSASGHALPRPAKDMEINREGLYQTAASFAMARPPASRWERSNGTAFITALRSATTLWSLLSTRIGTFDRRRS